MVKLRHFGTRNEIFFILLKHPKIICCRIKFLVFCVEWFVVMPLQLLVQTPFNKLIDLSSVLIKIQENQTPRSVLAMMMMHAVEGAKDQMPHEM